jgi:SAM-dependent methyltransferase
MEGWEAKMSNRVEILRDGISRTSKVIEIGPSFSPLTPKSEGWNSWSVDYLDQKGLIEKFQHEPFVNTAMIEPVDFVWSGGSLSDAIPVEHHGTFDTVLASHVIEHIPDLIRFFQSTETLVHPGGTMILALPDKRVCFDFFRPLSTTGDLLIAYQERRLRHSAKTFWDCRAFEVKKHGAVGWARTDQRPTSFTYTLAQAMEGVRDARSENYVDAHAWVFTPASYELIMLELAHLGLTDWQIERKGEAQFTEFYVWLRRGAIARTAALLEGELAAERMRLLVETMLDLDDQSRQLTQSRASILATELGATCRQAKTERNGQLNQLRNQLERIQEELTTARTVIAAVRSSRAWRFRSRLRRILRLPLTRADR